MNFKQFWTLLIVVCCVMGLAGMDHGHRGGWREWGVKRLIWRKVAPHIIHFRNSFSELADQAEKTAKGEEKPEAKASEPVEAGNLADKIRTAIGGNREAAKKFADTFQGFETLLQADSVKTTGDLIESMMNSRGILKEPHREALGELIRNEFKSTLYPSKPITGRNKNSVDAAVRKMRLAFQEVAGE